MDQKPKCKAGHYKILRGKQAKHSDLFHAPPNENKQMRPN